MKHLRGKLTYANVISSLALFLVISGGAAYAASLGKNTVGTKQIKNGAVTAAKVKSGSLLASNFKSGQLPKGETGKEGSQGKEGSAGKEGPAGTALAYAFVSATGTLEPGLSKGFSASEVSRPGTGTFCFSKIPTAATSAVATASSFGENPATADQYASVGFAPEGAEPGWTGCAHNDPVRVTVYTGATLTDQGFTIWFEG